MGFAHVQGAKGAVTAGTSFTVTLGATPTLGNLVCVAICCVAGATHTTPAVKDSNNNSYTSAGGFNGSSTVGQVALFYLLSAPSNATAVLTCSYVTSGNADAFADEFSVTGGIAAFDLNGTGSSGSTGTSLVAPTITPSGASELYYGAAACGGTWATPTAGGTLGVMTGNPAVPGTNGGGAEYSLSVSAATAFNATQTTSSTHIQNAMLFKLKFNTPDEDYLIVRPTMSIENNVVIWR